MFSKFSKKIKKSLRFTYQSSLIVTLEIIAVVAVCVALLAGFVMWKMSQGPIDLSFAREYIEQSMNSPDSPYSVRLGRVVLNWQGVDTPMRLDVSDFTVLSGDETIVSIRELGVRVYKRYLLLGQVSPKAFIISEPTLKLIRTKNNEFKLDVQEQGETPETENTAEEVEKDTDFVTNFLERLSNDPDQSEGGTFARLRSLRVQDARVVVEDRFVGVTWLIPDAEFIMRRSSYGLEASGDLYFPGGDGNTHINANANITRGLKNIDLEAAINNANLANLSQKIYPNDTLKAQDVDFSAKFNANLTKTLKLTKASFTAESETGKIVLPQYYEAPLTYDEMQIEADYSAERKSLTVQKIAADINGLDITFDTDLKLSNDGIEGPLRLSLPKATIADIRNLHPDKVRDDDVDQWLFRKIKKGSLSDLKAEIGLSLKKVGVEDNPGQTFWRFQLLLPELGFQYRDLDVAYADGLIPVTDGAGNFSLSGEHMIVGIEEATLGSLNVKEGRLDVTNIFTTNSGAVDLDAELEGPLTGVIDFVQVERLKDKINYEFQPDLIKGDVKFDLRVDFPTAEEILFETITYEITGNVERGFWPDALNGVPISGGPFDIRVSHRDIELKGPGKLGDADADIHWHEYFETSGDDTEYDSKITASVASTDELRLKLGVGLEDYISGILPVEVNYLSPPGPEASAKVTGDLDDLSVFIDFLNFERRPLGTGSFELSADFRDGDLQNITGLAIQSEDMEVDSGKLAFIRKNDENQLSAGTLTGVKVDENIIHNLAFEITAEDVLKIKADGSFLDARWFVAPPSFETSEMSLKPDAADNKQAKSQVDEKDQPKVVSASFERMIMDPEHPLETVKLYIQTDAEQNLTQLEMDAVAGEGDIYLRYKPDEQGVKGFRLEVDDAGAGLRAFDLYDNVSEGELTIVARPKSTAEEGNFEGMMVLKDFKVTKAPVLAKLISAMSLPGIAQLLNDDGVQFARLESRFEWVYQSEGARIKLDYGRTSGNSLGLTFEGLINRATERVDISGTIVPVSGINSLISNIPLIGNIFAGDQGEGVFAATYEVKGPIKDPRVIVNPLAVLAPGFLRDILFEDRKDDTVLPEQE